MYHISYRSHKSNWNKLHYFFSFVFILHQRKKNKTEWKHMFWSRNSLTTDVKVPKIFTPCCWLSKTHIYQTLTSIPQHVHRKAKHVCKHRRKSNAQSTYTDKYANHKEHSKSLIPRPQECLHNLERN